MTDAALNERDDRGNWRPAEPIALAPINAWPPRPVAVVKWLFGFPGYIWPYHLFWLGVTLITWAYVTFQMAEVAVSRDLFEKILALIGDLRRRPVPA